MMREPSKKLHRENSLMEQIKAKARATYEMDPRFASPNAAGMGIKTVHTVLLDDVLALVHDHEETRNKQLQEWLANPEVLDQFALLEHEQWTHWIDYMDKRAIHGITTVEFTNETWDEWLRKASMHYCDLTESEKESDRKFALKVLQKFVEVQSHE